MDAINHWLGLNLDAKDLTLLQISLRGIVVFVVAIAMVRVSDKRFLAKLTAFDAILGFILASMLARAVNGTASFFPTLGGGFVLVLMHRFLAHLARRWHWFGELVKGHADLLIKHGQIREEAMRANNLSERDLEEELRQQGQVTSVAEVEEAYVERSGEISVVPKK